MSRLYTPRSNNLSLAWAEVLVKLIEPGITTLSPVVVTISEFDGAGLPIEHEEIRNAIDGVIPQNCRTVANTIFPNSLWAPEAPNDERLLYERYEKIWPRVQKDHRNRRGVYFRRLTAFLPKLSNGHPPVNQLQHVIDIFRSGNHRHSALQAAIFDPTQDHSNEPIRGFPCLHQVAFGVQGANLEVTGFYALQHHIPKAYGNYLGLCWLGRYMAKQMGLRLSQVTCIASLLKPGDRYTKTKMMPLKGIIEPILTAAQKREG